MKNELVEIFQFAAFAFSRHPALLAGIVSTRAMHQAKRSTPVFTVTRIQPPDFPCQGGYDFRVFGTGFRVGIRQVRQDNKPKHRVGVRQSADFQTFAYTGHLIGGMQNNRHDDGRRELLRNAITEIHFGQSPRMRESRHQPVYNRQTQNCCRQQRQQDANHNIPCAGTHRHEVKHRQGYHRKKARQLCCKIDPRGIFHGLYSQSSRKPCPVNGYFT